MCRSAINKQTNKFTEPTFLTSMLISYKFILMMGNYLRIKLRKSSDPTISNGVYINQFLSRIEAQLAYEERCKRRSKPYRTSASCATAANNIINNDNNNKTSTTIVVTNSSTIQQATQQDVMSSQLNPEASFFRPTPGVEQTSNIGPNK